MSETQVAQTDPKKGERRPLRTCLIVAAGCAGIAAIGLCITLALGIPVLRSLVKDFDWVQNREILGLLPDDFLATLGGDEFGENFAAELDEALDAALPAELGESGPDVDFRRDSFFISCRRRL